VSGFFIHLQTAAKELWGSKKGELREIMEFVVVIVMFLFIVFCAGILGLAISETFRKKGDEKLMGMTTTQTGALNRDGRA